MRVKVSVGMATFWCADVQVLDEVVALAESLTPGTIISIDDSIDDSWKGHGLPLPSYCSWDYTVTGKE